MTKYFNKDNLIGIKYLIPKQNELLVNLKQYGISEKEIDNLYELTNIDKNNYLIFDISILELYFPIINIPEYMTFILMISKKNEKGKNKNYYLDYYNYRKVELINKKAIDFKDFAFDGFYVAITFISKNMAIEKTSENINNLIDLKEECDEKDIQNKSKKTKLKDKSGKKKY